MKKAMLFSAISIVISSFTANADSLRLIVSTSTTVPSVSASAKAMRAPLAPLNKEQRCVVTLGSGTEICFAGPEINRAQTAEGKVSKSVPKAVTKQTFTAIDFEDQGADIDDIIATLNQTGWYDTVEKDVIVRNFGENTPNDPDYNNQTYLRNAKSLEDNNWAAVGHDFEAAWGLIPDDAKKIQVLVLDSEFARETSEMPFASGYSFVSLFGENTGTDYIPAVEDDCIGAHGLGVASAIGAVTDNGVGMAGAAREYVEVSAARVMSCGVGALSDVAPAIRYAANMAMDASAFPDLPARTKPFDVINLSLGGESPCPAYMQSAIDEAISVGVSIVISSGNDNGASENYAPGNCVGVITVGAVTALGDRAEYSNYGANTNVSAQGNDIYGLVKEIDVRGMYEGTSFSAPLVTSAIALAKAAAPNVSTALINKLAIISGDDFGDKATDCIAFGCGESLLNAKRLVTAALKAEKGEMSMIRHALAGETECQQEWYVDHFGQSSRLCSLFEVDFLGGSSPASNTYVMYRTAKGESFDVLSEEVLQTKAGTALIESIDATTYDYAFKMCEGEEGALVCDTTWYPLNSTQSVPSLSPAACN